jgi:YfiH family protein
VEIMTTQSALPALGAAFRWSDESWGVAVRCRPLEAVAQHLFTTRQLALRPFDAAGDAWRAALAAVGGTPDGFVRVKQVHGNVVHVAHRNNPGAVSGSAIPAADAVVSNVPGVVVGVQVADCVPLLLGDARTGAVGAIHAGWRGTRAGIARATVDTMVREFNTDPADLVVALGPSIGKCCYEVGAEVRDAFRDAGGTDEQIATWFTPHDASHWWLDLWSVNRDQLVAAGVPLSGIHLSQLCTKSHVEWLDSYRVEGERAGRMAALIRGRGPGTGGAGNVNG